LNSNAVYFWNFLGSAGNIVNILLPLSIKGPLFCGKQWRLRKVGEFLGWKSTVRRLSWTRAFRGAFEEGLYGDFCFLMGWFKLMWRRGSKHSKFTLYVYLPPSNGIDVI
jgi:hypothetical protein